MRLLVLLVLGTLTFLVASMIWFYLAALVSRDEEKRKERLSNSGTALFFIVAIVSYFLYSNA